MTKTIKRPRYGAGHTKYYNKSVVSDFLVEKSNDDLNVVHFNNDIHLLLRQKNIHKVIGTDVLRTYLEELDNGAPHSHKFSDDELFSLIDPKGINTITDCYEFSRYLQEHSDDVNNRYKTLKKNYESLKTK